MRPDRLRAQAEARSDVRLREPFYEESEHLELARCQPEAVGFEWLRRLMVQTLEHARHSGDELVRIKWLGYVVVGADQEAGDSVKEWVSSPERNMIGSCCPQRLSELVAY